MNPYSGLIICRHKRRVEPRSGRVLGRAHPLQHPPDQTPKPAAIPRGTWPGSGKRRWPRDPGAVHPGSARTPPVWTGRAGLAPGRLQAGAGGVWQVGVRAAGDQAQLCKDPWAPPFHAPAPTSVWRSSVQCMHFSLISPTDTAMSSGWRYRCRPAQRSRGDTFDGVPLDTPSSSRRASSPRLPSMAAMVVSQSHTVHHRGPV